MLDIKDRNLFLKCVAETIAETHLSVADTAVRDVSISSIAEAVCLLEGDTTFLHFDPFEGVLHSFDPAANGFSSVGETSSCPRAGSLALCRHLAAREILGRYASRAHGLGISVQIDFADAVFFDSGLSAAEKFSLLTEAAEEGRKDLDEYLKALIRQLASAAA